MEEEQPLLQGKCASGYVEPDEPEAKEDNLNEKNSEIEKDHDDGDNDSTVEEKEVSRQTRRSFRWSSLTIPLVLIILTIIALGLFYNKINFGKIQKLKSNNLKGVSAKMKYVLGHSTPGTLWLFFCFMYAITKRSEDAAEMARSILESTMQLFVLHITSQLILVTFITAKQTLNLIPTLNLLFFIGRIICFFGHPHNRFGFLIHFVPLMTVMSYIGFRYVRIFL